MDSYGHGPIRHRLWDSQNPRYALYRNQQGEDTRQQVWWMGPQDSAIHFTGDEISFNGIFYCSKKSNGELCEMVKKRERWWVKHLMERAEQTAETYNVDMATKIHNTTYKTAIERNLIPDREALTTRIGNMIKSPNSTWAEKKQNPEWVLPRTYFDG